MKRTKQEQEATKKLLLEVAWYLFEKEWYYHTSLDYIAKTSWLTRGAIYWNFSGKIDLFEQLLDHNQHKLEVLLELDFVKTISARQKLENIIWNYFDLLENDESFRQVERLQIFEKFIWKEMKILEKFSSWDIEALESYVEEIYKEWILTLEFKNNFLPREFSKSFTLLFLWIMFMYLWNNDFKKNKIIAIKSLNIFLKWIM
jgi:AcrR family transcriptional regulator